MLAQIEYLGSKRLGCLVVPAGLRDQAEQDVAEKEIQYSKDQASKRPGYDGFHGNLMLKLKNPERVKFWAFAAKAAEDYFKNPLESQYVLTTSMFISPIPHHLSNLLPGTAREEDHTADMAALNIGTTALAEAKNTTRMIRKTVHGWRARWWT
jgi:hypothetical protein